MGNNLDVRVPRLCPAQRSPIGCAERQIAPPQAVVTGGLAQGQLCITMHDQGPEPNIRICRRPDGP